MKEVCKIDKRLSFVHSPFFRYFGLLNVFVLTNLTPTFFYFTLKGFLQIFCVFNDRPSSTQSSSDPSITGIFWGTKLGIQVDQLLLSCIALLLPSCIGANIPVTFISLEHRNLNANNLIFPLELVLSHLLQGILKIVISIGITDKKPQISCYEAKLNSKSFILLSI